MTGRHKFLLVLLYLQGIVVLSLLIYNVQFFSNPPFIASDHFSNNLAGLAVWIADAFAFGIVWRMIKGTTKLFF